MSWDLYFVPPEAQPDIEGWLEGEEPEREHTEAARRHADAVLRVAPGLQRYETQLVSNDDTVPLTVDLYGTYAAINVAYWPGTTATAAPVVGRIAEALAAAGPFLVYDPQDGAVVAASQVEQLFRAQHPRGARVVERYRRRSYRSPGMILAAVALAVVVLHRSGLF